MQLMQVALSGGQIWKLLLAERFTQVVDSNPWVRCASGNVFFYNPKMFAESAHIQVPKNIKVEVVEVNCELQIFLEYKYLVKS